MQTMYKIRDHSLLLSDSSSDSEPRDRKYILKFHDMPLEEKPREKLLRFGPSALSVSELLATILGVGTKKEDVLSMSSRILKEYGEKSIISQKSAKALAKDLDIPQGKAIQIVACAELGRRFFLKNRNGATVIRKSRDVFEYAKDMCHLPKEHLRGIYLDTHNKIIHDEMISIGTINTNIIHPREVFRPALEYSAVAMILVHNHPSGVTNPSKEDYDTTKRIYEAGKIIGIELLDHLIVTEDDFQSIPFDYQN